MKCKCVTILNRKIGIVPSHRCEIETSLGWKLPPAYHSYSALKNCPDCNGTGEVIMNLSEAIVKVPIQAKCPECQHSFPVSLSGGKQDEFNVGDDVFDRDTLKHGVVESGEQVNEDVPVRWDSGFYIWVDRSELFTLESLPRKPWPEREEGDVVISLSNIRGVKLYDVGFVVNIKDTQNVSCYFGSCNDGLLSLFEDGYGSSAFATGIFLNVKHPEWLKKQEEPDVLAMLDKAKEKINVMVRQYNWYMDKANELVKLFPGEK